MREFSSDLVLIVPISTAIIVIYSGVSQFVGILASIVLGIFTLIFAVTNAYRRTGRILSIALLSVAVAFLIIAMGINVQGVVIHHSFLKNVRFILYVTGASFLSLFLLTSLLFRKGKYDKPKNVESYLGRFLGVLGATLGNAMCLCLTPAGILALVPIPFIILYQPQVGAVLISAAFSHELRSLKKR